MGCCNQSESKKSIITKGISDRKKTQLIKDINTHETEIVNLTTIPARPHLSDYWKLRLISGSGDGEIIFWSNELKIESKLTGDTDGYWKLFDLKNGKIAAANGKGDIDIIQLNQRTIESSIQAHNDRISAICWILHEKNNEFCIATASCDKFVRIWNIETWESFAALQHPNMVFDVLQHSRTGNIISCTEDKIYVWTTTNQKIREIEHKPARIQQILELPESTYILSICINKNISIKISDIETGNTQFNLAPPQDSPTGFTSGIMMDKNTVVLIGAFNNKLCILSLNDNKFKSITEEFNKDILQIIKINDEEIITCQADNSMNLINLQDLNMKTSLEEHSTNVTSLLPILLPLKAVDNTFLLSNEIIIQIGIFEYKIKTYFLFLIAPLFNNIQYQDAELLKIPYMNSDISFNQLFLPLVNEGINGGIYTRYYVQVRAKILRENIEKDNKKSIDQDDLITLQYVTQKRIERTQGNLVNQENTCYILLPNGSNSLYDKVIINEQNIAESIILANYFPLIRTKYLFYMKQLTHNIYGLFALNQPNLELWVNVFNEHSENAEINLRICTNGYSITIDKFQFIERTSLFFWKNLKHLEDSSFELESKEFDELYKASKDVQFVGYNAIKDALNNFEKYIKGEEIIITSNIYSFLLSFAYYYKLIKLRNMCEKAGKAIHFEKENHNYYFYSHFNVVHECILNHIIPKSKSYCSKCKESICIDCHLFSYLSDPNHLEAIREMYESLEDTQPLKDNPHKQGFYVYTDVLNRLKENIILNSRCIYIRPCKTHLLKILRIYNQKDDGEFVLKQIIPMKGMIADQVIKNAKQEYEMMNEQKNICITTYNFGSTNEAFEMLMENWGIPSNNFDFTKLNQKEIFQIFRETAQQIHLLQTTVGLVHRDIKLDNLIFNKSCCQTKFIDFGISLILPEDRYLPNSFVNQDLCEEKITTPANPFKGFTPNYAPPEQLQYREKPQSSITYILGKIDVFCLGMVYFSMITRCDKEVNQELVQLRTNKETENDFYNLAKRLLEDGLRNIDWEITFKDKLFEIIIACLNPDVNKRISIFPLVGIFDYFQKFISAEAIANLQFIDYLCDELQRLQCFNREFLVIRSLLETEQPDLNSIFEGINLIIDLIMQLFPNNDYKDKLIYGKVCYLKGKALNKNNQFKEALIWLKISEIILENRLTSIHQMHISLYQEIVISRRNLNLFDDSFNYCQKALDMARVIYGNKTYMLTNNLYNELALIYKGKKDYYNAEKYYKLSLEQFKEIFGDQPSNIVASIYFNLSVLYFHQKKFNESIGMVDIALDLRKKLYNYKMHPKIAVLYMDYACVYDQKGEKDRAAYYFMLGIKGCFLCGERQKAEVDLFSFFGYFLGALGSKYIFISIDHQEKEFIVSLYPGMNRMLI